MSQKNRPDELHPAADPDRWDALVARIMTASGPELARRRSVFARLRRWAGPVIASAASVAAVAVGTLLWSNSLDQTAPPTLAEAVLPSGVVTWMDYGEAPTIEDLFADLDDAGGAP